MLFPHVLFKKAGLTPSDVSALCGVSRVTGWRWMSGGEDGAGAGVNIFLRDRVQKVADEIRHALEAGALPDVDLIGMPPGARAERIKTILRNARVPN